MDAYSERRVVTCLFIDVVGSTDLMMRLGPELMRRRLSDAFDQMSARIAEHGGTVENYVGDAIFALFGAPTAHVDDPERALRAARACSDWSSDALAADRLAIRVGIETGEALVDLDATARRERMAIGACVNIAARLQQQASPAEIVVGPTTHAATSHVARFEPLGALDLKGLGQVEAWRFDEFVAPDAAARVPFVGREAEVRELTDALGRSLAEGTAALALIVGTPGLGKSRLAEEVIKRQREESPVRVIEIRCRPSGEVGANTPLRQLIAADVRDVSRAEVQAHVASVLGTADSATVADAISHGAGLGADARLLAVMRFEQRELIADAWRRYLNALVRSEPLILWVEDVHWADPVLVRMIDHVTSRVDGPLFVIATARPEFADSAHLRPAGNRIQVNLEPLDAGAASALAEAARGDVEGLERAAGNPLFIIELARSQAPGAADLPLTIQAAISARLDELSPAERQLLQHAAVAGETFTIRDASLLSDQEPAEVVGMLGRIAHLGFVTPVGAAYRFHHALVRDVAYGRLPVGERLSLHARYAERGVAPGDVEALAYHLWQAVGPPEATWAWDASRREDLRSAAFEAHMAAGLRLEERNQYEQASEVYARAAELATDGLRVGAARAALGRALQRQARGDAAWAERLEALAAFERAGAAPPPELYADMLEVVTLNWGYFRQMPPDDEVHRLLDEGERLARASGDDVSLARLLTDRAAFTGDSSAIDEVIRLVDSADAVPFADAAQRLAQVLLWAGQLQTALDLYQKVFRELIPAGAVINEAEALVWYGLGAFEAGDLALARTVVERFREALARGGSPHTRSHLLGLRALITFGSGDWDELSGTCAAIDELVGANPQASFCLIACTGLGYGAAAAIRRGRPVGVDLSAAARRMVPMSELVQASSIMLPNAMLGDADAVERGLGAYSPGLGLLDRATTWDVCHVIPAVALAVLGKWELIGGPLSRLDECAAGGSRLSAALAAVLRREQAGAGEVERPEHRELLDLGYRGLSDVLRHRPVTSV